MAAGREAVHKTHNNKRFLESRFFHPLGFVCNVRRSKLRRRSFALKVLSEGKVEITVPYRTPQEEIIRFVDQSKSWISRHIKALVNAQKQKAIDFSDGAVLNVFGDPFVIRWCRYADLNEGKGLLIKPKRKALFVQASLEIEPSQKKSIVFEENAQNVGVVEPKVLSIVDDASSAGFADRSSMVCVVNNLIKWLRQQAQKIFLQRVRLWSMQTNIAFIKINQRDFKRLWGLYRQDKKSLMAEISINWRLALAPLETLDGVVVHELCHHLVRGHSKDFWQQVYQFYPNYNDLTRQWLKQYGNFLFIDRIDQPFQGQMQMDW